MALSKQLYIIISLIFFMIFTGNFIISVKNTKEYLEIESTTKAQDTATSLGMSLKSLMKDKQDPEIVSIINAIANRGFYKEIRLENVTLEFTQEQLIKNSTLTPDENFEIIDISLDSKIGTIEEVETVADLTEELAVLENETLDTQEIIPVNYTSYNFIPGEKFIDGQKVPLGLKVLKNDQVVTLDSFIELSSVIVKVSRAEKFEYIPQWFIDLIPIKMEEMKSEISDGWNITAVIYVSANAGDAYAKLYEQVKGAIVYAVIAFLISILFLVFFLRFILQPLHEIENLAHSITRGNFKIIEKLPWTKELKNVSVAMNDMSSKIEGVINKLNGNLENMTKKLSEDGLTKLQLKSIFLTDVKKMFLSKTPGFVFIIKINDLSSYAKTHTNKEVDQFLIEFSDILKNLCDDVKAYRFFGSEFAVILQNRSGLEMIKILDNFKEELDKFGKSKNISEVAYIGGTPLNFLGTTESILSGALEACEIAKQIGPNEYYVRDEDDVARDIDEWKNLIFSIIDNKKFKVGFIGQTYELSEQNQNQLYMEEAFSEVKDNDHNDIPIATFISIAEQYEKIFDFDKAVVESVIDTIINDGIKHNILINLSFDSVLDIGFRNWLKNKIAENNAIAPQLVFGISAYMVDKDIEKFEYFVQAVHSAEAKIMIKRFETKFISLNTVKGFDLDYIRLARDYTDGISQDGTKEGFVESMQDLCGLLNIKLFAENVKDDTDLELVKKLKLFGASR